MAKKIRLDVQILEVGENFVALATVGGVNIRGTTARTEAVALAGLFGALAQNSEGNGSDLALELAVSGRTLADLSAPALEDGGGED